MKIPNTVMIQGHTYTIEKRRMDGQAGECFHTKLKIIIDDTLPQSVQEETLIHEVIHAIRAQLGQELDETAEEKIIQPLALGIYQFLKDNKLLK